jgi:hypothetical protein
MNIMSQEGRKSKRRTNDFSFKYLNLSINFKMDSDKEMKKKI